MTTEERKGKKKIQCWIDAEVWDKLEAMGFKSQTAAVTKAFENLIGDPSQIPEESFCIPELRANIEGLKLLVQEKDERISDLRRETETLNTFAHYFKSLDYRRLENPAEVLMEEVKKAFEKPASKPERSSGKKVFKKICKECGEEFDALSDKAQTCSSKCRAAFNRKSKKER